MKNLSNSAQNPFLHPLQPADPPSLSTTPPQIRSQESLPLQSPRSFENFRVSQSPRCPSRPLWRQIKRLGTGGKASGDHFWTGFKLEGLPQMSKPSKSRCTVRRVASSGAGRTVVLRNMSKEEFFAISDRQREIWRGGKPRTHGLKFKSRVKKERPDLCPSAKMRVSRGALKTLKSMIGAEGSGKASIWPPGTHASPQLAMPQDDSTASDAQAPIAYDPDVKKRRRQHVFHRRLSKPLPPTPQQLGSLVNIMDSIQTQTSVLSPQPSLDDFPEEISPISFILYRTTSEIPYPETPYPESPLSNR